LGGWLHTELNVRHRELNPDTVTHPSTVSQVYANHDDDDDDDDAGGRINFSGRLAVDGCGCLLVLDVEDRRVVQFDISVGLRLVREVVTHDARLRYPARLCVDHRRGRLYVADNELIEPQTRLQTKFWGRTGRVLVYDTLPS